MDLKAVRKAEKLVDVITNVPGARRREPNGFGNRRLKGYPEVEGGGEVGAGGNGIFHWYLASNWSIISSGVNGTLM